MNYTKYIENGSFDYMATVKDHNDGRVTVIVRMHNANSPYNCASVALECPKLGMLENGVVLNVAETLCANAEKANIYRFDGCYRENVYHAVAQVIKEADEHFGSESKSNVA